MPISMEELVRLCKARGFVFPSAEIYGGFRSTYDYGPLGVLMARNVKEAWWRSMVQLRQEVVGLDAAILSSPKIWEASGHLKNFTDPLVDCRSCKQRWRADQMPATEDGKLKCPNCGSTDITEARPFNLMFKTFVGPVEDEGSVAYLRPETAQGHFVNFANVLQTEHLRPPFGTAQIGKSFRNEITPGNFVFRTREFEQMELEYFVPPADSPRPATGERYVPHVIEPAAGVARTMMAFLIAGYTTDEVAGEPRTVLRLHPRLAPYQVAVLPLSKKDTLLPLAEDVLALLQPVAMCDYDVTRAIGRRYRRQDEIGTPLCVTIDFASLDDKAVTVRDRDSTAQERVPIDRLVETVTSRLAW
jgi:glycyl-tRNA synthetase (class II)